MKNIEGMKMDIKNSAGIILFNKSDAKNQFLILRAYSYWDFPKGGVEKGESFQEAAIRETKEETGITDLHIISSNYYSTEKYSHPSKMAHYFVAETNCKDVVFSVNQELGRPEHDEFLWCSYEEACKKLNPRVKKALIWATQEIEKVNSFKFKIT